MGLNCSAVDVQDEYVWEETFLFEFVSSTIAAHLLSVSLRMYMCCVSFYWSTAALETGSHVTVLKVCIVIRHLYSPTITTSTVSIHVLPQVFLQSGGGAMPLSGALWLTSGSSSIWRAVFARGLWELLHCLWYCSIQVSMGKGQQTAVLVPWVRSILSSWSS